jgi:deoxyadenosine/deoxycytidine kinase
MINLKMEGKLIIVEGIPGSGKTTLCNQYKEENPATIIFPEWVDKDVLIDYLSDMKNKAYSFQCRALEECRKAIIQALELVKEGKTVLIDRGPIGNSCFAQLQYTSGFIQREDFMSYLKKLEEVLSLLYNVQPEILYLDCSVEICLDRISKRGTGETYTKDYMEKLKYIHEQKLKPNY